MSSQPASRELLERLVRERSSWLFRELGIDGGFLLLSELDPPTLEVWGPSGLSESAPLKEVLRFSEEGEEYEIPLRWVGVGDPIRLLAV